MTRLRVLVTLAFWLLLSVALAATDARPAVLVLGGVVVVASAAILVTRDLARSVGRVEWIDRRQVHRSTRGSDPRVGSLQTQLYDARWFGSRELHHALVDLVDDRLLVHHRIDRSADEALAMEALSPALRRLVAGTRPPATSLRELHRILADLEAL